ncbi:MAG: export transporter periplasmic protein LptC, partial [Cyanobacteriota bacterium]
MKRLAGVAVALLMSGCVSSKPKVPPPAEPFVFKSLDLEQQDPRGRPAWHLKSPEARYDITRQVAQARQPLGTVFKRGKANITIRALSATVIGDGQAIQLEGDVVITLLGKNPVRITGEQARWIPSKSLMLIDRKPAALDRQSRITAQLATYYLDRDLIELRGSPVLEQWDPKAKGAAKAKTKPAPLRVQTAQVDWKPEQGDLKAPQQVRGLRRDKDGQLNLTASALNGNLRAGFVDLIAPVQVRDPKRKGWLNAQQTRWLINDQQLSSDQPFQGAFNKLQGEGQQFKVNLATSTVFIPVGCNLRQPGEELTAQRCQWNWPTGRFQAQGDVVLRRQAYKQITRSSELRGSIGKDGTAV